MTKVVLVNIGEYRKYGQIDEGLGVASVGLESIAAHLHINGVAVELLDQAMYTIDDSEVLARIVQQKPDIVGFNPLINSRKQVGELATRIKESNPATLIVIGGYDASFLSLTNKLYEDIDVIVRGKGEIPTLELAKGKNPEQIKGISYRKDGKVVENLEQRADAPRQLPIPLRQNMNYLSENREPVSIYASYGCFYRCEFCSTPGFYAEGRTERDLESILKEISYLADNGIKRFSFYDEDFFGLNKRSLQRATKIVDKVKEIGGEITFSFITTQGIIQAEKHGLLQEWEGTVNRLYVGIEGGCDKALEGLGNLSCRRSSKNSEAIGIVRGYNVGLHIGFIMFNAYSSFEELEASARFLHDHDEAANCISFFHHLRPYKGTAMYDRLKEDGLLIEEEALTEMDLHSSLPYHFRVDVESGNERIKDFARAICPVSGEDVVCESDKLNNEIYLGLVRMGQGKAIFDEDDAPGVVVRYRDLRKKISNLNYRFFVDSLKLYRDGDGQGFEQIRGVYLDSLRGHVQELRAIKGETLLQPRKI
jgi:radical SAM superfamily enzyme YgiQ (UPF0313 family)